MIPACQVSNKNEDKSPADALNYKAPLPGKMSPELLARYQQQVSQFFDSTLLNSIFNGSILVARDGEVIYEKYQGLRDLQQPDSINEHTAIHLASTSKPFMSIAILRLVQEKRLSLSDSIRKFFPELPFPGITVSMLLSHRSGLPNYLYYMDHSDWDRKVYATNADVYRILCRDKPEGGYPPDTHYSYSNTNFVLLALILEKLTGLSYPEYMRQKFFIPLGMNDTYVFTAKDSLTATPSFTTGGKSWGFDYLDQTYGDKNIYSTPRDLLKFDQALYTDQLIRTSLLDSAFMPQSLESPSIHNYGLGWRLQNLPNGKRIVYHFGRWHGCNAAFSRLVDEKVTIIILGNRFTRMIYNTAHKCYSIFGDYGQKPEVEPDENIENVKEKIKSKPEARKRSKTHR
jgi:CubicO group peptidase (beta-lactamase class C family)